MGCCVGGLAKPQSTADRSLGVPLRRKTRKFSKGKRRQWSSSPEKMENNISVSYSLEAHLSSGPATANEDSKCSEKNGKNLFVNQAAVAWNEMRKEWVGDRSKQPHRVPREPMIRYTCMLGGCVYQMPGKDLFHSYACLRFRRTCGSWCTTYEDLLTTSQRFPQPIPLSEMVDFLVDIWHEEGLYD